MIDFYASKLALSERRLDTLKWVGLVVSATLSRLRTERQQAAELRRKVDQILVVVAGATKGDLTLDLEVVGVHFLWSIRILRDAGAACLMSKGGIMRDMVPGKLRLQGLHNCRNVLIDGAWPAMTQGP